MFLNMPWRGYVAPGDQMVLSRGLAPSELVGGYIGVSKATLPVEVAQGDGFFDRRVVVVPKCVLRLSREYLETIRDRRVTISRQKQGQPQTGEFKVD